MKSVALVGMGPSMNGAHELLKVSEQLDIWVLNDFYVKYYGPWDMAFEMHDVDVAYGERAGAHRDWLNMNAGGRHIMTNGREQGLRNARPYPLAEVDNLLPDMVQKAFGDAYFTSTLDYMLSLALYWRYDNVYLYGFELDGSHQLPGAQTWITVLAFNGIEVINKSYPNNLFGSPLYGYEPTDEWRDEFYQRPWRLDRIPAEMVCP